MTDRRLLRLAGLGLLAGVWVLGVVATRPGGSNHAYLLRFSALLIAFAVVDWTLPQERAPAWRRALWLAAELALSYLVVRVHGTLVRPILIYMLPASRALLLFGPRLGPALSLLVWPVFALNIAHDVWPDRLDEYPNYLVSLLAPYILAVVLTQTSVRQAADRRRLQTLYDELRQAHDELRELHRRAREAAVTEERNRLAREIHDSLAHYLTVINVQLEAAEKLGTSDAQQAAEQVRRARRLTLECLQEVRRSVAALRAATLDELSLVRALRKLVSEFNEHTGIEVSLCTELPDDTRFAPELSLALYRVAQEGLTNVHRHARARFVRLLLARNDGRIEMAVEDDGAGPPAQGPEAGGGFGLIGLRERVDLLGGCLAFERGPAGGSRLVVTLPMGDPA